MAKMQNSPFKFHIFSFLSSKFHFFPIESFVSVPLVLAVNLPKQRSFGHYLIIIYLFIS